MSERYLLFDGGCSVCAALAREVETLSEGRLGVRSLRDPEVQALLDRARPGWRWEPMLVEIEGERVRVLAGLSLRARLVQVLGPAQALRMTQLTLAGAPSSSPVRA
jgi:predicted DCC family thiol-disulfide oxidoreductase YuxK